jgi:hypothetical protein
MVFGVPQICGRHIEEIPGDRGIIFSNVRETRAFHQPHRGVDNRFGGKPVCVAVLKAKDIAGQMECTNLSPSVGEEFVAAGGPFDDLIDIFGGLALAKNLSAAPVYLNSLELISVCDRLPSSPRNRGRLPGPALRFTNMAASRLSKPARKLCYLGPWDVLSAVPQDTAFHTKGSFVRLLAEGTLS